MGAAQATRGLVLRCCGGVGGGAGANVAQRGVGDPGVPGLLASQHCLGQLVASRVILQHLHGLACWETRSRSKPGAGECAQALLQLFCFLEKTWANGSPVSSWGAT